jgi:tetratricopeptide (TPR) repeat protein
MSEPYNPDEAKRLVGRARELHGQSPESGETREAWLDAARAFEPGAEGNAYAASQAMHCYRKAGRLDDAQRVIDAALESHSHDRWVASNAAWVAYDQAKQATHADDVLPRLARMVELATPLADRGPLMDSVFYRLRRLVPRRDDGGPGPQPLEATLQFLVDHFEALFEGCTTTVRQGDRAPREPVREQLVELMVRVLRDANRWDDLAFLLERVTEDLPERADLWALRLQSMLEIGRADDAIAAAEIARLECEDATVTRLHGLALRRFGDDAAAEEVLRDGCYRFRDPMLWRELAVVRALRGRDAEDAAGANRALAVALRLLEKADRGTRRALAVRLHLGRVSGAIEAGDLETAAQEYAAAARLPADRPADTDKLAELGEQLRTDAPDALAAAEAMSESELTSALTARWSAERDAELAAALKPARVVHIDRDRGFGFVVLTRPGDAGEEIDPDAERIEFALTAWPSDAPQPAEVGAPVRILPRTDYAPDGSIKLRAIAMRPPGDGA